MTNLTIKVSWAFLRGESKSAPHKQKRGVPPEKRGAPPVVKPETRLWYFCGQMEKRIFGPQFSPQKARKKPPFSHENGGFLV